jgi:hypothetical protein
VKIVKSKLREQVIKARIADWPRILRNGQAADIL